MEAFYDGGTVGFFAKLILTDADFSAEELPNIVFL